MGGQVRAADVPLLIHDLPEAAQRALGDGRLQVRMLPQRLEEVADTLALALVDGALAI